VAKRLQVLEESDVIESDLDSSLGSAKRKIVSARKIYHLSVASMWFCVITRAGTTIGNIKDYHSFLDAYT